MRTRLLAVATTLMLPLIALTGGCSDDSDPTSVIVPVDRFIVSGDVIASSQTDIDELAGCYRVYGTLITRGSMGDDPIRDLSPLLGLSMVEELGIMNTKLEDLSGLDSLETVTGSLFIAWNDSLTSLDGLANLRSAGTIELQQNPQLTSLAALGDIEQVEELSIRWQHQLTSLDLITDVGPLQRLSVQDCQSLTSLSAGDLLPTIRALHLSRLPALARFDLPAKTALELEELTLDRLGITEFPTTLDFPALTSLWISGMPQVSDMTWLGATPDLVECHLEDGGDAVTSLAGMTDLTSLRSLTIDDLPALASLDGLAASPILQILEITDCPGLTDLGSGPDRGDLQEVIIENTGITELTALGSWTGCRKLRLASCPGVESLDGLAGMVGLTRLRVYDCPGLLELATDISLPLLNDISIVDCPQLTSLAGFSGSPDEGGLSIIGCGSLTSLQDYPYPADLWRLTIADNDGLQDLSGLETVTDATSLTIRGNDALTSLDGLDNLEWALMIEITDNPQLPWQTIGDFLAGVGGGFSVTLRGNGP